MGVPLLVVSFALYLRGSMRGTALFIGSLASFLYQYLLWTFDWAYNSLFLVYVAIFLPEPVDPRLGAHGR